MPSAVDNLIPLRLSADDYTRLKSWELAQWCSTHGADAWGAHVMTIDGTAAMFSGRFSEVMAPFSLPTASRRPLMASPLWELSPASLAALREFLAGGIFTYEVGADGWLEDLTLYRRGEMMLGVVSHEGVGILRVTHEERQLLERGGFPFRASGVHVGY